MMTNAQGLLGSAPDDPTYRKWTDADIQEFAEWIRMNTKHLYDDRWFYFNKEDRTYEFKTTSQLRESWEVETGRREK